jgi:type I restriction enzyme, S subunit
MSFPRYPAYKPSGVEWLGEVPEHWETLRLRFAVTLNPSKQEAKELGEQEVVSFLPMEAIGEDGSLRLENEREVAECLSGYTYFRDGDVCVAKITPCFENGKGAILRDLKGGIGFGTTELIVARPEKEKITSEFLDYLFRSQTFRRLGESEMYGAGGQKRVPDSFVRDFIAALPSIEEQNQATTFLDHETAKIDALIAEQQRLIELLQEKRQAVISHAVTKGLNPDAPMKDSGVEWLGQVPEHWKVTRLRYFSKSLPGFAFPSSRFVEDEGQWKLLRGINVGVSNIRWDETVYWKMEEGDQLEEYILSPGDLVVGLDRPLIKEGLRVARIQQEDCPCLLLQRVAAVKCTIDLAPDFLYHLLSSRFFVAHFEPDTTGVSVPHISTSQIDSFVVPVPPREEQIKIINYLSEVLGRIKILGIESTKSISILRERRSALISAAVTGQIDVHGLVSEVEAA